MPCPVALGIGLISPAVRACQPGACPCKTRCRAGDQVFLAELGCSSVLVDHAAEGSMMSDRSVEWDHGGRIVVGVLVAALVDGGW